MSTSEKQKVGRSRASGIYLVAAPLLLLVLSQAANVLPLFQRLEWLTWDLRFRARAPLDQAADPRVVVVGIDEASLERFGKWPWPRSVWGDFCELVSEFDPGALALDIFFTEPSASSEEDQRLASGAALVQRLVTGALSNNDVEGFVPGDKLTKPIRKISGNSEQIRSAMGAVTPLAALAAVSHFGFVDSVPTSDDDVRRRIPLLVKIGGDVYPSFGLKALMLFWRLEPEDVEVRVGKSILLKTEFGPRSIPINEAGEIWLNDRNPDRFSGWSFEGLFRALYFILTEEKPFPKDKPSSEGRILITGQIAEGLTDFAPTPLSAKSPLVLAWVNAIHSILQEDYLHVVPFWPWGGLAWLLMAWASLAVLREEKVGRAIWIPLVILAASVLFAFFLFVQFSVMVPLAIPMVAFGLLHTGSVLVRWTEEIGERRLVGAELALTAEAKKRLEQELSIAREIQMSTLPLEFPAFPERSEIDIHAHIEPAKLVGGDLYDFYFIDDNRLFFVLGDVAGKGLPASLFMTMALSVFRAHAAQGLSPDEILARSNNVLAMRNPRSTFVTTFCGVLDLRTGHLDYANGGHNPPARLGTDGSVTFLQEEGIALGALEDMPFTLRSTELAVGEAIFIYTDGVTEANNLADEQFEDERLKVALTEERKTGGAATTAEMLIKRVRKDLATFVGKAPPFDDITMLAFFYRGSAPSAPE